MAAWMLHGDRVGAEAGARNLMFSRVKWLQAAMKGTSCVRRLRLRLFHPRMCSSCVLQRVVVPVCIVLCVCLESVVADRSGMAA